MGIEIELGLLLLLLLLGLGLVGQGGEGEAGRVAIEVEVKLIRSFVLPLSMQTSITVVCSVNKKKKKKDIVKKKKMKSCKTFAVAGDRTRVTRVTGGNTYHYTTTT